MNPLLQSAGELQAFLVGKGLPFCFIGGIAVLRWGSPRTTQDVDVSLFVTPQNEDFVIRSLLERFPPRVSDAEAFAKQNRVVLARSANQVSLDIALAEFDFEKEIIERATPFQYADGVTLTTISAEDLVVMKAFAGRDQDWLDIQGIAVIQKLDRPWILEQLERLCQVQTSSDSVSRLTGLFRRTPRP